MKNDPLQGIIFTPQNRTKSRRTIGKLGFNTAKYNKKYFHEILDYAWPGGANRIRIQRRYTAAQDTCSELIAADLIERLHITIDKTNNGE